MLYEFLKGIEELAKRANSPAVLPIGQEPSHRYAIVGREGSVSFHAAEPQPRNHTVFDLADLVQLAEDASSLWYSRAGVYLKFDDETRRDQAVMKFEFSPQLNTLSQLASSPRVFAQKPMVHMLRVNLAGCLQRSPQLVEVVRKLKFRKTDDGHAEIDQGRASIGREVTAQITGSSAIPNEIVLTVPIWNGYPYRADVECSFDADADTQNFTLQPMAGAIENAIRYGEKQLGHDLAGEVVAAKMACPVYYGQP